jgi:hypothetical protein
MVILFLIIITIIKGFGEVLGGKTLDDCFYFNSLGDAVTLTHPLGVATISISGDTIKTFQVYTPPSRYSIAIGSQKLAVSKAYFPSSF